MLFLYKLRKEIYKEQKNYELALADADSMIRVEPRVDFSEGYAHRAEINTFLKRYALANTDWFDLLFRNSLTQEHSLSISSGTDKSQSFFSTSFYNDGGWTVADKVK